MKYSSCTLAYKSESDLQHDLKTQSHRMAVNTEVSWADNIYPRFPANLNIADQLYDIHPTQIQDMWLWFPGDSYISGQLYGVHTAQGNTEEGLVKPKQHKQKQQPELSYKKCTSF